MGNRILKIFMTVLMTLAVIILVVFMIMHIRAGLEATNSKLLLAGYIALILYACRRIWLLVRDLLGR